MRFFSYLIGTFIVGALATGGSALAASPLPAVAPSQETTNAAAAPVVIAPHRALYNMALASTKNGGHVTGASGHMLFEWRDVCDGWAIQQHMQLHFSYGEGEDQDITSTELTWESKDGKKYNFNIHHLTNGKETEVYRGKAMINSDGSATVSYILPAVKTVQLPIGTLFPSTHTKMILQKAALGEKLFSRRVFDGSDENGSSDISAFITAPKAAATEIGLSPTLKQNPLLAAPAWPVRMAFYAPGDDAAATDSSEPAYVMDLDLLPNGVARHMNIDYGDFAVTGTLEDLQAMPSPSCS